MDVVDAAQAVEAAILQDAMSRREVSRPTTTISALVCVGCGEPIPEARRQAMPGCSRCVACQLDYEDHTHA